MVNPRQEREEREERDEREEREEQVMILLVSPTTAIITNCSVLSAREYFLVCVNQFYNPVQANWNMPGPQLEMT